MAEQPSPALTLASRNKILIIIGLAVVVPLAVIAWAVSSQAIRAKEEEAAAKERAIAQESGLGKAADVAQKVLDEKMAEPETVANDVCERRFLQVHPTYAVRPGTTGSTFDESSKTWETKGDWTEEAAGSTRGNSSAILGPMLMSRPGLFACFRRGRK